jgi:hypothetical protein
VTAVLSGSLCSLAAVHPPHLSIRGRGVSPGSGRNFRCRGGRPRTVNRAGVDPADTQAPIWEVSYRIVSRAGRTELPRPDLAQRSAALRRSLAGAREFTVREPALQVFGGWFDQALALLESDEPSIEYYPDLLPAVGYSLEARRLVAAAARSWVFGGMGSWNDIGFSDATLLDAYKAVSEDLYTSVIEAFRDGTNSSSADQPPRRRWLRRRTHP